MKNHGRLFYHTAILSLSSVLSKLAVFLLMPLYTACLSPSDFGMTDILVNVAVLLIPLATLNIPQAVFRFCAGGEDRASVFSSGALILLCGMLIFLPIACLFGLYPRIAPFRVYLMCYVAASSFRSFFTHFLRADGQYSLYAVQQLFCTLMTVLLQILFLRIWGMGVGGYLLAVILSDLATALILVGYLAPWRLFSVSLIDRRRTRDMLHYAMPLIPASLLSWITAASDRYIILFFHGEALTGLYAAAGRIPALLGFAVSVFMEAWHYAFFREEGSKEALFEQIYVMLLPFLVGVAVTVILFSGSIVRLIFAGGYADAARYVPFLTVAVLFSALSSFLGSVYAVRLRSVSSMLTTLCGAAVNLLLNFLLIPRFDAFGAALSTLVAHFAVFLIRALHCRRCFDLHPRLLKLLFSVLLLLAASLTSVLELFAATALLLSLSLLVFSEEILITVRFLWGRIAIFQKNRQNAPTDIDK
ncbi:MAG: hypothetical protein E7663_00515 [Ruminococcaceae bacterium]|nr:hypothetical protein [Oscillospiraceae bacterium]